MWKTPVASLKINISFQNNFTKCTVGMQLQGENENGNLSDKQFPANKCFPEKSKSASQKPKLTESCIFFGKNAENAVKIRFLNKFFLQIQVCTRIIIFVPVYEWEDERYDKSDRTGICDSHEFGKDG